MVNLLSRAERPAPFPILDPDALARFEERLAFLVRAEEVGDLTRIGASLETLAPELESALDELEVAPSMIAALELVETIDLLRRSELDSVLSGGDPPVDWRTRAAEGELLCYRPGRSLATGEAEVASRGYFDVRDRPPLGAWLCALARSSGSGPDDLEIGILSWVPARDLERARAGCEACPSGAMERLDAISQPLAVQLTEALRQPREG